MSLIPFEECLVVALGPIHSSETAQQETVLSKMGKGKTLKSQNFALFSINFLSLQAL